MAKATNKTMRPKLKQEPFPELEKYGTLDERIILSKYVRDRTAFLVRFWEYIGQNQTKWYLALAKGRHGWSTLRAILEYRDVQGRAVLDAFRDVMLPMVQDDSNYLSGIADEEWAISCGQLPINL